MKNHLQAFYEHVLQHKKEVAQKQMAGAKVQQWLQQKQQHEAVIDVGQ